MIEKIDEERFPIGFSNMSPEYQDWFYLILSHYKNWYVLDCSRGRQPGEIKITIEDRNPAYPAPKQKILILEADPHTKKCKQQFFLFEQNSKKV